MSIAATYQNSQRLSAFDADVSQLARDMEQLHRIARSVTEADDRTHFAHLAHTVDWRLNILAYVLAAQDMCLSNNSQH